MESRQKIGKPTQVFVAEMGPARADDDRRIRWLDIGPAPRHVGELARVVGEVDPVLAPRLPAIDQTKGTSM